MKAFLNKDNRIKRDENYGLMSSIRTIIANRIRDEYNSELSALATEQDKLLKTEFAFYDSVWEILKTITPTTKVKIITQVGPGSSISNEHIGTVTDFPLVWSGQKHFNFISHNLDNEKRTIGFSCLQSIEII